MRKRMMIIAGALALSLALAGCSPAQPAVDGREESKPNKTQQTSEGTSEEATKPEEKITESASNPEETSSDKEKPSEEEGFSVAIDAEHFPDEVFRKRIFFFDKNENGMLEEKEVKDVRRFNLTGDTDYKNAQTGLGIKNLKGIEYFTELRELYCSHNQLTVLDVSALSKLETLDCNSNRLLWLNVSGLSELETLDCNSNRLDELNVSGFSNLETLDCSHNWLTVLNVSGLSNLVTLDCSNNRLSELDIPDSSVLWQLNCSSNGLRVLNLKDSSAYSVDCSNNQLTELETGNIAILHCNDNQLTSLMMTGYMDYLECFNNPSLTSIRVSYDPFFAEGSTEKKPTIMGDPGVEVNDENGAKWMIVIYPDDIINVPDYDPNNESSGIPDGDEEETSSAKEGFSVAIDAENFPDEAFRNVVAGYDKNGNGMLESTEVKKVVSLNLASDATGAYNGLGIKDLKGIEYFFNLKELNCSYNQLTALDVSELSKLDTLDCSYNQLTELNVSGLPDLIYLDCSYNQLTELDVSGTADLNELRCKKNKLISLKFDRVGDILDCSENQLTELNAENVGNFLVCHSNRLTTLKAGALDYLNCYDNQLTSLEFDAEGLCSIYCHKNNLTSVKLAYSGLSRKNERHLIVVDSGVEVIKEITSEAKAYEYEITHVPTESPVTADPSTGALQLPDGTYGLRIASNGRTNTAKYYESQLYSWYSSCKEENGFLVIEGKIIAPQVDGSLLLTEGPIRLPLADHAKIGISGVDGVHELETEELYQIAWHGLVISISDGVVTEAVYSE